MNNSIPSESEISKRIKKYLEKGLTLDEIIHLLAGLNIHYSRQDIESLIDKNPLIDGWGRVIPGDIWDDIIGYDDFKAYMNICLTSPEPISMILHGTPASAKSMFLMALESINGRLVTGSNVSNRGLADILVEEDPDILLFDEMEKVKKPARDLAPLLTWIESGRIKIDTHLDKLDHRHKNSKWMVVAAINHKDKIPAEFISRFDYFYFSNN